MAKNAAARPVRRHLTQPVGHHAGPGNGVRVHAIYFAAVSLVALLLALGAAIVTTAR